MRLRRGNISSPTPGSHTATSDEPTGGIMRIPYVIDNQSHLLSAVLSGLLAEHKGRSLDVATAYFTVGGFGLIGDGLGDLGSLRLLLGAEPVSGEQIGLRPDADAVKGLIRKDMEVLPFDEKSLRLVEDLIAYLRRETVQVRLFTEGFLHAKCWLFYSDRPGRQALLDRFRPIVAIVGSSNFTAPGLTSNKRADLAGTGREIDILLSTDVLSEGRNLQDCGHLLNYDLHWNPTRKARR